MNCTEEAQTTSVTFLEGSGKEGSSIKMKEIPANRGYGYPKFLPVKEFKAWATNHGEVFKLKATVTLYQKVFGDDWIRYRISYLPICLVYWF